MFYLNITEILENIREEKYLINILPELRCSVVASLKIDRIHYISKTLDTYYEINLPSKIAFEETFFLAFEEESKNKS